MDTIQIVLIIVLTVSAVIMTIVGIQLIFILYQARSILSQATKIMKGFDSVGTGLQHGLGELTGFVNGFKTIMKIIELYNNRKKE
jgi:hypothetical protein